MANLRVTRSGRIALIVLGIFVVGVLAFSWVERARLHPGSFVWPVVFAVFVSTPSWSKEPGEKFDLFVASATGLFAFALTLLMNVIGAITPDSWMTGGATWRQHGSLIAGTALALVSVWVAYGFLGRPKQNASKQIQGGSVR